MSPLPQYLTQDEPQRFFKVLTSHRNCSPQFGGGFLLDSLFQAGYGYSREQAQGSLLDKAMQMLAQAEG
jgi:hypothetical protein